jgi:hypothetical protein
MAAAAAAAVPSVAAAMTAAPDAGDTEVYNLAAETLIEALAGMVTVRKASGKTTGNEIDTLSRLMDEMKRGGDDGTFSICCHQRNRAKEAAITNGFINVVNKVIDYPMRKAEEIKATLRGLPDRIWMLSDRRKLYVYLCEMRPLLKHIGCSLEEAMSGLVDTPEQHPAAAAASGETPPPSPPRAKKTAKKKKKATASKTGQKRKTQKKK